MPGLQLHIVLTNQARALRHIHLLILVDSHLNRQHRQQQGLVAIFNHNRVENTIHLAINGVINDMIQIQAKHGTVTGGDIGVKTVETKEIKQN